MSLYDKASIFLAPGGYKEGRIFNQKPLGEGSDLNFDRGTAASVQTRETSDGNITTVGLDIPRINYEGNEGYLLIEPQATNTATDSNDFTVGTLYNGGGSAGVDDAILTSAQATSPDGNNNAWKLVDNNDGNTGSVQLRYYGTNVTSANYNVVSLFVKKQGNNDWFQISFAEFDSYASAFFNISNGTLGTINSNITDANIEGYGDGWYRISATFATTTDVVGAVILRLGSSNGSNTVTRNGTNGAYIYGIQAETQTNANATKPTSYIPTSGGTVTRAKETAVDAGNSDLISSTEGVLYLEVAALKAVNNFESLSLSNGNNDTRVRFMFKENLNQVTMQVNNGSTSTSEAFINHTVSDVTDFNKFALKYKENDFAFWINGVEVDNDTSGTVPSLDRLNFTNGSSNTGANPFHGKIKCIAVFKEALSDSELQELTT